MPPIKIDPRARPKHGPYARCVETPDGWELTLNAAGQELVTAYFKEYPDPVRLVAKQSPGMWAAMIKDGSARDEGSEEASAARLCIVRAALTYVKVPGAKFSTYANFTVWVHVLRVRARGRIRKHLRLRGGGKYTPAPGAEKFEKDRDDRMDVEEVVAAVPPEHRATVLAAYGVLGHPLDTPLSWARARGTNKMDYYRTRAKAVAAVRKALWLARRPENIVPALPEQRTDL